MLDEMLFGDSWGWGYQGEIGQSEEPLKKGHEINYYAPFVNVSVVESNLKKKVYANNVCIFDFLG